MNPELPEVPHEPNAQVESEAQQAVENLEMPGEAPAPTSEPFELAILRDFTMSGDFLADARAFLGQTGREGFLEHLSGLTDEESRKELSLKLESIVKHQLEMLGEIQHESTGGTERFEIVREVRDTHDPTNPDDKYLLHVTLREEEIRVLRTLLGEA